MNGSERAESANSRIKSMGFARDVLINILANLAAAAIIYLVGVLAGVIPRSPALITLSTFLLLLGSGIFLAFAAIVWRGRLKGKLFAVAILLLGLGSLVGPFVPGLQTSRWDKIGFFMFALAGISAAITFFRVDSEFDEDN